MKIGPVQSNLPASLIEFCRMQRMLAAGEAVSHGAVAADAAPIAPQSPWMPRLSEMPDVRSDKVERVRAALHNGTYESNGKLDAALDRMIDQLPLNDPDGGITNPRRM